MYSGKILFLDSVHEILQNKLEADGFVCEQDYKCSKAELAEKIGAYVGLVIRSRFILDKEILEKAKNLKFIARSGSGMENIDTTYAQKSGILCLNSPEGNRDAVGEHALGMLLNLLNKISIGDKEVKAGKWLREANRGTEIGGKIVGIIGFGNTGSSFAKKLQGFDCEILAYDKFKKGFGNERIKEVSMDEIFSRSDIVSLHIPLSSDNHYFVNDDFLKSFKKHIWLINTSRGEVLETSALVKNLKSGKVLGACLDVLEYEMKSFENLNINSLPDDFKYLASAENVILTPHVAGWTKESYEKLSSVLYQKIVSAFLSR